jgi:hypothetical protein
VSILFTFFAIWIEDQVRKGINLHYSTRRRTSRTH